MADEVTRGVDSDAMGLKVDLTGPVGGGTHFFSTALG
jgi:hypothetical protein